MLSFAQLDVWCHFIFLFLPSERKKRIRPGQSGKTCLLVLLHNMILSKSVIFPKSLK